MAENSGKNAAQVQFAKLQRASDAKQAMAEYEAEAVAVRARTAQLRALRLARDAELAAAEAAAPAAKKTKAAAPKTKAAPKPKVAKPAKGSKPAKGNKAANGANGTLADWIETRDAGGHNN